MWSEKGLRKRNVCVVIICIDSEPKGVGVLMGGGVPMSRTRSAQTDQTASRTNTQHTRSNTQNHRQIQCKESVKELDNNKRL